MLCRYRVPDTEFVMSFEERPLAEQPDPLPVFSWARSASSWDIQYPYINFAWIAPNSSMVHVDYTADDWHNRQPIAVWRGSTTGASYNTTTWNATRRARLVALCRSRPDLCDAKFTNIVQAVPDAVHMLKTEYGVFKSMSLQEQEGKYKYQLVVPGNFDFTASRSVDALKSKMTPLWVYTSATEFFYALLQPYEHYIPVASDLSDLLSQIEWANMHAAKAKLIALNGQRFAKKYLHTEFTSMYMFELISSYTKLLHYKPKPDKQYARVVFENAHIVSGLKNQAGSCFFWNN